VLSLLSTGKVKADPIITHVLPLKEFEKGFNLLRTREAIKVLMKPNP